MNLIFLLLISNLYRYSYGFSLFTKSMLAYGGYSFLVDLWATKHVNKMKENDIFINNEIKFNFTENEYMVSKSSHIIEDLDYRNDWNFFMKINRNNYSIDSGNYTFIH